MHIYCIYIYMFAVNCYLYIYRSSKKQEIFVHHDLAGTSLWLDAEKLDLFWSELGLAYTWVCLKMVSTPKPNGFADHYPY